MLLGYRYCSVISFLPTVSAAKVRDLAHRHSSFWSLNNLENGKVKSLAAKWREIPCWRFYGLLFSKKFLSSKRVWSPRRMQPCPDPMIWPLHLTPGEMIAVLRHCTHILFLVWIYNCCLALAWFQPLKDKKVIWRTVSLNQKRMRIILFLSMLSHSPYPLSFYQTSLVSTMISNAQLRDHLF